MEKLKLILESLVSTENGLCDGSKKLEEYTNKAEYPTALISILNAPARLNFNAVKLAAILMKNYVLEHWEDVQDPETLQDALFSCAISNPAEVSSHLVLII